MRIIITKIRSNMKSEVWKDIEGYTGLYKVSNTGKVVSLKYLHTGKEKVLKEGSHTSGYLKVALCKDGVVKKYYIHRLVALHFVEGYKDGLTVNHKDENKSNNHYLNLEWMTQKENINYGTARMRTTIAQSKPVIQHDLKGNIIGRFFGISEAARTLAIHDSDISKCCKGKRKSAGGFIWKYDLDTNNQNPF